MLFFFFFFATECVSNCSVGSFPTPFSSVACGFSDIVIYLSVRRCWTFTVRVTRHLNAIGLCFGVHLQVVFIHCVVVGIVGDCFVFIDPGYFVSLTMDCVVVTEPFDLTSLVEGARSPFQIGCKLILATSVSRHGWGTVVM